MSRFRLHKSQRDSGRVRKENLLIHLLSIVLSPTPTLLPPLFRALAMVGIRGRESIGRGAWESYPNGEHWAGPPDPPEPRRFPDLRTQFLVSQTMLMRFGVPSSLRVVIVERVSPSLISRTSVRAFPAIETNRIQSGYTTVRWEDLRPLYDLF